jgi:hypothetical protein
MWGEVCIWLILQLVNEFLICLVKAMLVDVSPPSRVEYIACYTKIVFFSLRTLLRPLGSEVLQMYN